VGAGANVNYEDPAWITPLNLAVYNGHLEIAGSLLEHGANPNDDSLYLAVELRNLGRYRNGGEVRPNPRLQGPEDPLRLIRLLLDKGADPNGGLTREIQSRSNSFQRMSSITGLTTLQRAAQSLDIEVMKLLLDRGADPNKLTMAAEANLDGPDWGGHLALLSAVGGFGAFARDLAYRRVEPRDQGEAVKLLLDRGAQVNARNFAGMTALHLAAQSGSNALVQLLVDHGARLDLKDFWDRTPLDAAGGGHQGLDGFSSARPARPETQALLRRLAGAAPAATATSDRDSKGGNSDQGPLR
jgi:ankyrin repeat protein